MQIVSPSGTVYEWDKETPPTESDIAALQEHEALLAKETPKPASASMSPDKIEAYQNYLRLEGQPGKEEEAKKYLSQFASPAYKPGNGNGIAAFGLRAGGPAAGAALGAPLGPLGALAGAVIGGVSGEYGANKVEGTPNTTGRLIGAGVASAIPGGPLAKASMGTVMKEGGKYALGNLVAKATETGVDEGRLPSIKESALAAGAGFVAAPIAKVMDSGIRAARIQGEQMANSIKDATRKATVNAGFVIPPAALEGKPSAVGELANAVTGVEAPAILYKEASIKNQDTVNKLAREYAGLAKNTPLGGKQIEEAIRHAEKPYADVAALSPQADANLKAMREATANAKKNWRAYERNLEPKYSDEAVYQESLSEMFHNELVTEAKGRRNGKLVDAMDQAKIALAKLHFLDASVNKATGNASPKAFGAAFKAGKPITDEGETIAKAYNAYELAFQDVAKMQHGASGRVPILATIVRKAQLSTPRQAMLANARYSAVQADLLAQFARFGTQSLGRDNVFLRQQQPTGQAPSGNPFLAPAAQMSPPLTPSMAAPSNQGNRQLLDQVKELEKE